nr:hypothetical protein Itr_chr03CG14590 [Ipomoea trifida]
MVYRGAAKPLLSWTRNVIQMVIHQNSHPHIFEAIRVANPAVFAISGSTHSFLDQMQELSSRDDEDAKKNTESSMVWF